MYWLIYAIFTSGFLLPLSGAATANNVTLTSSQVEQLSIELAQIKPASIEAIAVLPGTVVPAANARITAPAPFAGTVLKVDALPGQSVRKGDRLALIMSRELVEAQGSLAQQEAEYHRAAAVARWKRDLADKKILSAAIADEAEAHVRKSEAGVAAQRRAFAIGDIVLEDGGRYAIVAPEDGKVVIASIQPGAHVDAMAAAVTISTKDDLWIEAQLPADLVQRVRPGDLIEINDLFQGRVLSIGGSLDPLTRSATLLAAVPAGSPLIAGQMVSVTLQRAAELGSYEVPASSVAWINKSHAVFVRSTSGFSLLPVVLKGRTRTLATIAGPLTADQKIATSALPELEALLPSVGE